LADIASLWSHHVREQPLPAKSVKVVYEKFAILAI